MMHSLSSEPVGHWCLLALKSETEKSIFFDSLGNKPSHYNNRLVEILETYGNGEFLYNEKQVQSNRSTSCGAYVTYVADRLCMGYEFHECISHFSTNNLGENDLLVENYLLDHMIQ